MRSLPCVVVVLALLGCGGSAVEPDQSGDDLSTGLDAQIVVYSEAGWSELADAIAKNPAPGATYWMHIAAGSTDKTLPRGPGDAAAMRAHGPQFRAMAEFQWGAWSAASGSWFDKGVEFRRRMAAQGYDVSKGDTWAINELPTTTRKDPQTRQNVRDAIRGLYTGPAGAAKVKGAVFIVGMGSTLTDFAVYKPNLESWLQDSAFWKDMASYVRFWGQETYTDPSTVCVANVIVAKRSEAVNEFIEHLPELADAGGSRTATARSFLSRTYVPLLNAAWQAPAYATSSLSLAEMEQFVSTQIYAARSWGASHAYVAGRVGLGWTWEHAAVSQAEIDTLAGRVASSLQSAYDPIKGAAAGACSPSHAYTYCQCTVAGAKLNPGWTTFTSW